VTQLVMVVWVDVARPGTKRGLPTNGRRCSHAGTVARGNVEVAHEEAGVAKTRATRLFNMMMIWLPGNGDSELPENEPTTQQK
jgi:hypothetical protein